MPVQADWGALRRPLRSCAIGALGLSAFLVAWQLLAPSDNSDSLLSVLLALLLSAAFSTYLLVTAQAAAAVATPPVDFNTDEPHAYVSDIPRRRTSA